MIQIPNNLIKLEAINMYFTRDIRIDPFPAKIERNKEVLF